MEHRILDHHILHQAIAVLVALALVASFTFESTTITAVHSVLVWS